MKTVSPFAWQHAALDWWQRQQSLFVHAAAQSDVLRQWMKTWLDGATEWQQAMFKGSQAWLAALNIPTREELSRTIEQTVELEERLEQLADEVKQANSQEARVVFLEHELAALRSELSALRSQLTELAIAASGSPADEKAAADKPARSSSRSSRAGKGKQTPPAETTD